MSRNWLIVIGSLAGMSAVILGAFGAHGLEKLLSSSMLQRYHTGVEYQFYHALALLFTGMMQRSANAKMLSFSGYAFLVGILFFSGSLYAYALTWIRWIAMITPLGGLAFILGWLLLMIYFLRTPYTTNKS